MSPEQSRPRFSAVVVARNEELNIRRCLEHLAWCHERIVVDMASEDRTRELAAPLATAILQQEWIPHMEFARNHGIDAATGEWVLIVDADELIPEKLVRRLEEHVAANHTAAGFWIPRMNYFCGLPVPHTGGFPDYQLRCFRRGAGRYPDRLHSAAVIEGGVAYLPVEDGAWIVHDRKGTTLTDVILKFDTYAGKEARTRLAEGQPFGGPLAALWAGFSAFWFRFITARGYRDGMAGLLLSVLFAFYRFLVEAKAWELSGFELRWDRDVRRLGPLPRLAWALAMEGVRRIFRRTRPTRP
jgi:glycosyltransferase involved in cell wall biosynthesis